MLQRKIYRTAIEVPSELKDVIDQETFEKARLYSLDRSNFRFWSGVYHQIETTVRCRVWRATFSAFSGTKWKGTKGFGVTVNSAVVGIGFFSPA